MRPNIRNKKPQNFIFGSHPVTEALLAGQDIEKILITNKAPGSLLKQIYSEAGKLNIPVQKVPREKLNRITGKNHQGVIAFLSPITYQNLGNLLPVIFEKGEEPLILVLDRITDVRNFGAIARTAECAGVHAIVIPMRGAAMINDDAVKTSAGALTTIPVCREMNLNSTVNFLKNSGLRIIACTEKSDQVFSGSNLVGPVAVVMGAEDTGISTELLELADEKVRIPLFGNIGSLNVSVATGIILYEIVRQRAEVINTV